MAIVQLSRDNYKVRYRIGTKQFSKSGFTTKKEAKAWEAEQLRRIRSGSWTDPKAGNARVEEIYQDWLSSKQIANRTRSDYAEVWKACIAHEWAQVRVRDVNPAAVQRWISTLDGRYSAARSKKALTILSQVLDWAVADERIPENPVKKARALARGPLVRNSAPSRERMYLTHLEVDRLAKSAGRSGDMILVMSYTGVRFGEVTALQGQDVDLLRGRLEVRRAFSDVRGHLEEVTPKSGKARTIPIPRLLHGVLERKLSQLTDPGELLFQSSRGGPVRYSRWRRDVFNRAAAQAGLQGITPHALRHTYAALAVQAGANPKVLQAAMGHSDIRLTLDTYGGLFGDDLDALAQGLDFAAEQQVSAGNVPNSFPSPVAARKGT